MFSERSSDPSTSTDPNYASQWSTNHLLKETETLSDFFIDAPLASDISTLFNMQVKLQQDDKETPAQDAKQDPHFISPDIHLLLNTAVRIFLENDKPLTDFIETVRQKWNSLPAAATQNDRAKLIMGMIYDTFGGDEHAKGFYAHAAQTITALKKQKELSFIDLGDLLGKHGTNRHRALLFKLICDQTVLHPDKWNKHSLPVRLQRAFYKKPHGNISNTFNVAILDGKACVITGNCELLPQANIDAIEYLRSQCLVRVQDYQPTEDELLAPYDIKAADFDLPDVKAVLAHVSARTPAALLKEKEPSSDTSTNVNSPAPSAQLNLSSFREIMERFSTSLTPLNLSFGDTPSVEACDEAREKAFKKLGDIDKKMLAGEDFTPCSLYMIDRKNGNIALATRGLSDPNDNEEGDTIGCGLELWAEAKKSEVGTRAVLGASYLFHMMYEVAGHVRQKGLKIRQLIDIHGLVSIELNNVNAPPEFTDPKSNRTCALLGIRSADGDIPDNFLMPGNLKVKIVTVRLLTFDECLLIRQFGPTARKAIAEAAATDSTYPYHVSSIMRKTPSTLKSIVTSISTSTPASTDINAPDEKLAACSSATKAIPEAPSVEVAAAPPEGTVTLASERLKAPPPHLQTVGGLPQAASRQSPPWAITHLPSIPTVIPK